MLFFAARRRSASLTLLPLRILLEVGTLTVGRMCRSFCGTGSRSCRALICFMSRNTKKRFQAITGKNTTETIPKSFLLAADDIVIVDVPPDLCLWRQGETLTATGISNFQERQLSELRELALLLARGCGPRLSSRTNGSVCRQCAGRVPVYQTPLGGSGVRLICNLMRLDARRREM